MVSLQVYLAEWTGCPVAVKELLGFSNSSDDPKAWQELRHEVSADRVSVAPGNA